MIDRQEVTALLREISDGTVSAPQKLLPLVYDELRKLAHSDIQNERRIILSRQRLSYTTRYSTCRLGKCFVAESRPFLFGWAQVMRNILVNHAVKRKTQKRDFGQQRYS